jgi:YidC/Oxa1 family membrane protein insertase
MQQKRLLLALLISVAILFTWSQFFAPPQPTVNQPSASPSPSPANPIAMATPAATPVPNATPANVVPEPAEPQVKRTVTIKTPLYEAKVDSTGAEVVSWIIKKNKDSGREIYSVAGNKNNPVPLELVSPEGLKRQPRQVPLQVLTGDRALDATLSSSSYALEGVDSPAGDVELILNGNEKKTVTFSVRDGGSGLDVSKKMTFDANNYAVDLELNIQRDGQVVPAKLKIGPSVGDQGIKHYTFYSVAPEGIASLNDQIERHTAAGINENQSSPDRLALAGGVDWAAVGDTYFAMAAIPSGRLEGLEFRTVQYDFQVNGTPEKRYLTEAIVPVSTDGSKTILYVGPKDHFILTQDSQQISAALGRPIDLEGLIDYGWFTWLSRPIAVPILKAIRWLHRITNSYGVAIILFTIVIYSLFFPLKWRSSKAMKKAQKLAPRMKELQEKIKGMKQNDPKLKELQMEQLRLMKEGNPLGGCLPLLIQMPFLFALYRAITISLDFRQASFLWLPDLSAGDPIHILEFLMAGTMIILQLITPAPSADPMQRKMMAIGMPLFMLYVLWGAPSGLLVYWLVGNIVGFSQQFLINYLTKTDGEPTPAPAKA